MARLRVHSSGNGIDTFAATALVTEVGVLGPHADNPGVMTILAPPRDPDGFMDSAGRFAAFLPTKPAGSEP
jgi:hypothetical protein